MASTFRNQEQAEAAIQRTFDLNRPAIERWLTNPRRNEGFSAEIGSEIGHALVRQTGDVVAATKVRVVLIPDETMPSGWRLLTAYPEI